jgi:hypothetical protein
MWLSQFTWQQDPRFWIMLDRSTQMRAMLHIESGTWRDHTFAELSTNLDEAKKIAEEKFRWVTRATS